MARHGREVRSPAGGTKDDEEIPVSPHPIVYFFQPRSTQQVVVPFSVSSGGEAALKRFLPKSHLSKVIIRDNIRVQRMQEIKMRQFEETKKKMVNVVDEMKKKFMHEQQRKMNRWKKEYSRYQRMLDEIDHRAMLRRLGSIYKLETQKSRSMLEWRKSKGNIKLK